MQGLQTGEVLRRSCPGLPVWLGEEVQSAVDATLEVMDATGDVVGTFTPAEEGEERDRWAGPALAVRSGMDRLWLDLRTDPGAMVPGMVLWGVRTTATAMGPGE